MERNNSPEKDGVHWITDKKQRKQMQGAVTA